MPLVQLPGGELRDEIRQPVYDGIVQAAAESPIAVRSFFSSVQGKAKYLTNLRQNNLLETAVSYRVQGLAIDVQNFRSANAAALPLIMDHSSLSFRVGEKIYWEGPFVFLGGRLEQTAAAATTVAATTIDRLYQKAGQSAVSAIVLSGKHVIDILPLQSFAANWVCEGMTAAEIVEATPAAASKLIWMFSLKGLLRRPVQ